MGDEGMTRAEVAQKARRWPEEIAEKELAPMEAMWTGGFFDALCHSGLRINLVQGGHALCTFRVPAHLTDGDGNWQPGAIATMIDNVGAAAIMTTEGIVKVSVQFDIAFFFPAKLNEEVEIDAGIVANKGKRLKVVVVDIRKKGGGQLVAVGRQWTSAWKPISLNYFRGSTSSSSKL